MNAGRSARFSPLAVLAIGVVVVLVAAVLFELARPSGNPSASGIGLATGSAGPSGSASGSAGSFGASPGASVGARSSNGASARPTATAKATTAPTARPTPKPTPAPTPRPTAPAGGAISHVVVIWLENHSFNQITPSSMPYLYGLSQTYGLATDYNAITHPSLPNYLAFWSGSTQGVTDDGTYNFPVSPGPAVPSLSTQMQAAGRSWRTFAEDYPAGTGCHTAATYGLYARRHNPAMSFTQKSGANCGDVLPLTAFNPGVNVAFVVPNVCNDAHSCPLGTADAFLKSFVTTRVIGSKSTWAHTLLVITFDEGSGSNRVFTVVARARMRHIVSATPHNHYSLLRTIESLNGLAPLANARSANTLSEFLR